MKKPRTKQQEWALANPWTGDTDFRAVNFKKHHKDLGGGRGYVVSVNKILDGIEGGPVWVASYSLRILGQRKLAAEFTEGELAEAKRWLRKALRRCGNEKKQKLLRYATCIDLQRAFRPDEIALLPKSYHEARQAMLGGAHSIIQYTGFELPAHSQPCNAPTWEPHPKQPEVRFPVDCGKCSTCLARQKLIESHEAIEAMKRGNL